MNIKEITPQIAAMYLGKKADHKSPVGVFASVRDIDTVTISDLQCGIVIITPHLRRIESMTEGEARELYKIRTGEEWNEILKNRPSNECLSMWIFDELDYYEQITGLDYCLAAPMAWLYLLSKGFDLFGLIDAGLAKEVAP